MTTGSDAENERVIRKWTVPPGGVRPADGTQRELGVLLDALPPELGGHLRARFAHRLGCLNEIYMQLGQIPECIFADPATGETRREDMATEPCEQGHVDLFSSFFAADEETGVATSKRKGIATTLHRISLITHPMRVPEKVLGVAVRVGRAMQGLMETMAWESFLADLAMGKKSLLLIGKPGVGKTTALREMARILAEDRSLNVVVVDKTCEIAGDGDTPHSAIGRARWMPVGRPDLQHSIMREAVENQTPDVIVVDEISTAKEVDAARTIAQRGVMLIATVHGQTLPEIINCRERGSLTGGCATVTLSGTEAERRYDKRKQVQKRAREPVFAAALELHGRSRWFFHPSVKDAADAYFEGEPSDARLLRPGAAVAVAAVPGEGCFEYCVECGLGGTCALHEGGHNATHATGTHRYEPNTESHLLERQDSAQYVRNALVTSPVPSHLPRTVNVDSSGSHADRLSFSASGSKPRDSRRKWRAPRGSGKCHKCGRHGHYARDCPS